MSGDDQASEFGGQPGLIQPPPHELTNAELAMLERQVNPSDQTDSLEAVLARVNGQDQ
jgi:hypothetical protein